MKNNFTQRVYKVVAKIPKGKVLSYKEVAKRAGSPKACRAVGNILNQHNIKGLPCHRVVGSKGKIGGYKWGIKKKIKILKKEGIKINYAKRIQNLNKRKSGTDKRNQRIKRINHC